MINIITQYSCSWKYSMSKS